LKTHALKFNFFLVDPEFSQHLLVGNALVTLRPFARFRERFLLFRRDWFVVDGSASNGAGYGSSIASSRPTTAESWVAGSRSISSWACRFSLVEPWVEPCAMRISLAKSTALR